MRWDHPEHGILSPAHFIELAEDNGTILSDRPGGARTGVPSCHRHGPTTLGLRMEVAVNLSARQFQQADLERQIAELLEMTGIEPSLLCLEITESLAMDDVDMTSNMF